MNTRHRHAFQQPEGADGAPGGGAAAPATAPAAAPAAPAAGVPAAAPPAGAPAATPPAAAPVGSPAPAPNLLSDAAALPGQDLLGQVPQQFHVLKEDGSLDMSATLLKQATSYQALHKRMVDGGAPPKDAKDYTVTVPEAFKESWNPDADEGMQAFRGKAHELGLTQKQFDGMVGEYLNRMPGMVQQSEQQQFEKAQTTLLEHYKTPEALRAGQRNAFKAVSQLMGEETDAVTAALGNNPLFIRFAAAVGAEMQEDVSPGAHGAAVAQFRGMTREQLMTHPGYSNDKHPDHKVVSELVRKSYEQEHGTAAAL